MKKLVPLALHGCIYTYISSISRLEFEFDVVIVNCSSVFSYITEDADPGPLNMTIRTTAPVYKSKIISAPSSATADMIKGVLDDESYFWVHSEFVDFVKNVYYREVPEGADMEPYQHAADMIGKIIRFSDSMGATFGHFKSAEVVKSEVTRSGLIAQILQEFLGTPLQLQREPHKSGVDLLIKKLGDLKIEGIAPIANEFQAHLAGSWVHQAVSPVGEGGNSRADIVCLVPVTHKGVTNSCALVVVEIGHVGKNADLKSNQLAAYVNNSFHMYNDGQNSLSLGITMSHTSSKFAVYGCARTIAAEKFLRVKLFDGNNDDDLVWALYAITQFCRAVKLHGFPDEAANPKMPKPFRDADIEVKGHAVIVTHNADESKQVKSLS